MLDVPLFSVFGKMVARMNSDSVECNAFMALRSIMSSKILEFEILGIL